MKKAKPTPAGDALTGLILDLFRLNSLLLTAGDRLVAALRLTSARWQVLGAIAYAERPEPVAWLARGLGANRQNVQRITNDLHSEGLIAFKANPHHRRAQLVVLTAKGWHTFEAAMRLQVPWVNGLADGFLVKDIEAASHFVMALRKRLEDNNEPEEQT